MTTQRSKCHNLLMCLRVHLPTLPRLYLATPVTELDHHDSKQHTYSSPWKVHKPHKGWAQFNNRLASLRAKQRLNGLISTSLDFSQLKLSKLSLLSEQPEGYLASLNGHWGRKGRKFNCCSMPVPSDSDMFEIIMWVCFWDLTLRSVMEKYS